MPQATCRAHFLLKAGLLSASALILFGTGFPRLEAQDAPAVETTTASSPVPEATPTPPAAEVSEAAPAEPSEEAPADTAPAEDTGSTQPPPPEQAVPEDDAQDAPLPLDQMELIPLPDGTELPDLPVLPDDALLPGGARQAPEIPILPPQREPERKLLARYKAVRVECEKDPALVELGNIASAARTYEDRRAALREYYTLLFKKMRQADPSLGDKITQMERAHLQGLSQTLIEPTIPLAPPPATISAMPSGSAQQSIGEPRR